MKKKYKIEVTQKDINDARKPNCWNCPIDFAAERVFECKAETSNKTILLLDELDVYGRFGLPDEAKQFVKAFDAGEKVKPFTFEVIA